MPPRSSSPICERSLDLTLIGIGRRDIPQCSSEHFHMEAFYRTFSGGQRPSRPIEASDRRDPSGPALRPPIAVDPTGRGKSAEANRRNWRSEEHTSELQSLRHIVCRLLLEKK